MVAHWWLQWHVGGGQLEASKAYGWRSVGGFNGVSLAFRWWHIGDGHLQASKAYRWRPVGGFQLADCWWRIAGGLLVYRWWSVGSFNGLSLAVRWWLQWCIAGDLLVASMSYHWRFVRGFNGVSMAVNWWLQWRADGISLAVRSWLQWRIAGGPLVASMTYHWRLTAYHLRSIGGFNGWLAVDGPILPASWYLFLQF